MAETSMDEMQGMHVVSRPAVSNLRQPHTFGNMQCANGDTHSLVTSGDMTRDTVTSLHVGIGTLNSSVTGDSLAP